MAQDYVVLSNRSENGRIAIGKSVLENIVENSVAETENVVAMQDNTFAKVIQVKITDNLLAISADIRILYGANVNATCEILQNKIYENILYMTGLKANEVTINVIGFEI